MNRKITNQQTNRKQKDNEHPDDNDNTVSQALIFLRHFLSYCSTFFVFILFLQIHRTDVFDFLIHLFQCVFVEFSFSFHLLVVIGQI